MHGGYSEVYGDCIKMVLKTSEVQIQIVREKHNLSVVFDAYVSPKAKKTLASTMHSGLCHTRSMLSISFKRILFKIFKFVHLKGSSTPNTTRISAVRVSAKLRMKTSLLLRRNFSSGIGNWALACFASKR
jgi:hypothetical protein